VGNFRRKGRLEICTAYSPDHFVLLLLAVATVLQIAEDQCDRLCESKRMCVLVLGLAKCNSAKYSSGRLLVMGKLWHQPRLFADLEETEPVLVHVVWRARGTHPLSILYLSQHRQLVC